jgi:putative heme-binding domain-containing protein
MKNRYLLLAACALLVLAISIMSFRYEEEGPIKERITVDNITLPKGFVIEKVYTPTEHGQGSWVSMTKDDDGRLYTSDQFGYLYRVTLPDEQNKQIKVEKLDLHLGLAQGLLWYKGVLYALVNSNPNRDLKILSGFYKITDTNGDGDFDKVTTLRVFEGSFGEHGPHNIELSPDKKSLYLVLGNRIVIPDNIPSYAPRVWDEDNLLPIIKDPSGHANTLKAPGGWVAKVDLETEEWTVHNVGMRNTYDIAFNQDGELFGFDSDMELDLGMPWYRPIRLCHFTSGSEFGWRTGTGKFVPDYPDNLPGIANLGQGSPTGLMNGQGLKFPAYYQNGMYLFDWSYGTMYFASLIPKGSSYAAEVEEFISGVPLPLTNGIVGDDGSLYFLTGGRNLESNLYKLSYKGERSTEIITLAENTKGKAERELRKELEQYHTQKAPDKLDFILKNLDHPDRFTRFSARIALENQAYDLWKTQINTSTSTLKTIVLAIATARNGTDADRMNALTKLLAFDWKQLDQSRQLDYLRAVELLLTRTKQPLPEASIKQLVATLLPVYLKSAENINRELCMILSYLQEGSIVEPTLVILETNAVNPDQKALYLSEDVAKRSKEYGIQVQEMLQNMPNAQHISYAKSLSALQEGWTDQSRERYFNWYNKALKKSGGHSYIQFIRAIQENALANVPLEKRQYYEALASEVMAEAGNLMEGVKQPKGPGQDWTVEDVKKVFAKNQSKASFENGRNYFKATLCANCHNIRGVGGNTGPELTQVGTRFSMADLAEAIVNPSGTISDRYRYTDYHLPEGRVVTGKVVEETPKELQVSTNAFSPTLRTMIKKDQIIKEQDSPVSPMPSGLVNRLNEKELSDLLAFLVSGGDKNHQVYEK